MQEFLHTLAPAMVAVRESSHQTVRLAGSQLANHRGNQSGVSLPFFAPKIAPPRSLTCRESPPHLTPKHAKHAHFSRYLPDKADWRERTARHRRRSLSWLFSGWHIGSPVSTTPPGECDAIRNRSFGESRVDFFVQHPVGTRLTEINTDRV